MALRPVTRRSVSDQVVDQVLDDVLDGELAVGDPLPSERRLAEVLGISRPAVREALQRVAASGLVDVRHGGVTTVRDYRRAAGLDLLPRLLMRGGRFNASVARSIVEARATVGPAIASHAAARGGPSAAAALDEVMAIMATTTDPMRWQQLSLDFWDVIVDAADSVVFRLMFNSMRHAYEPALPELSGLLAQEVGQLEPFRMLAAAIRLGDEETAQAAAKRVLSPTGDTLMAAFAALADDTEQS